MVGCHLDWVPTRAIPRAGRPPRRALRPRWLRFGREDCLPVPNARQLLADSNAFDAAAHGARTRAGSACLAGALRPAFEHGLRARAQDPARRDRGGGPGAGRVPERCGARPTRSTAQRGVFLGWLVSLTRNRAIDRLRARKTREKKTDAYEVEAKSDVRARWRRIRTRRRTRASCAARSRRRSAGCPRRSARRSSWRISAGSATPRSRSSSTPRWARSRRASGRA